MFPFAGRRRSSAVTPPELGSTGPEKAAASDALPASPKAVATADAKLAQVPQKVPPLVMASRAAAWSETARDSPETAPSPDDLRAAGAASVLAVSSVAEPAAVSSSTPAFPSSGSNTIVDGRKSNSESGRPAGAVSSTSTPTAVPPERGSLPPPPSPWAPPALGTAAGVPAEDLPSWWTGNAVPMELLEEEEPGLSGSAGSDSLISPLPVKTDMVPCESPSLRQEGIADEAPRQPSRSPELRPRSYRNSFRSKEQSGQRGLSPSQKLEKLEKVEKISRMSTSESSRPTTAGAESAANSAYSTSWRQEWNPSNDLSPAERAAPSSLQPLPARSNKPPPLPPLPMRPPESGSVLSVNGAGTGAALAPPPPVGKPTTSWEANPSFTAAVLQANLVVDESALRRLSSSANAKVATPPPVAKRREFAGGDDRVSEAPSSPKVGQAADLAVEPGAEGATTTPTSLDECSKHENLALNESKGSNFSELARSFAYMDMLA